MQAGMVCRRPECTHIHHHESTGNRQQKRRPSDYLCVKMLFTTINNKCSSLRHSNRNECARYLTRANPLRTKRTCSALLHGMAFHMPSMFPQRFLSCSVSICAQSSCFSRLDKGANASCTQFGQFLHL